MERPQFTREFKLQAVKLIRDRRVGVTQASRDLSVLVTVLRSWMRGFGDDPGHAFPGHGQLKREQAEIARLRRIVRPSAGRYPDRVRPSRPTPGWQVPVPPPR